jgi:UDP-N-acetylglucosamine 2-epimerase (non-hydrolysing)
MKKKVLTIFGTRPEAIKMAPLVKALESNDHFDSRVCVTAQHREMLDQVLDIFKIETNFDLNLMSPGQTLNNLFSSILLGMEKVYDKFKPDIILVHGDTTTSFSASLSAYHNKISIAHIEAGLRTGNIYSPWPEEGNRKLTASLANIHFAPTHDAKINLINENIDKKNIFVTGNTVIDSLLLAKKIINKNINLVQSFKSQFDFLNSQKKLILVTGHRRESFGKGFENICEAIRQIALKNPEVQIVYPVHLNPNVQNPVNKYLSSIENIYLIKPQEYLQFIFLMDRAHLILTDSGGIQEEAPSLGKPVLVMRDSTERPEAVESGTVKLVGTQTLKIKNAVQELLIDKEKYNEMSIANNPYGDGNSCKKICAHLEMYLSSSDL